MSKFPKTNVISSTSRKSVPKTEASVNKVLFSFEQFKCRSIKSKEFNNNFASCWEYSKWSLVFLDRLSNYSTMEVSKLKDSGKGTRCHRVDKDALDRLIETLQYLGITIDDQLNEDGLWELSLGAANGRVFGYFIDNIFYLLLFDPHHLIYPNFRFEAQHDLLYKNYDPWSEMTS